MNLPSSSTWSAAYPLRRIALNDFLEAVLGGCRSRNLIGIGSVRPSKKSQPFLHYLAPVAVEDRSSTFMRRLRLLQPAGDAAWLSSVWWSVT